MRFEIRASLNISRKIGTILGGIILFAAQVGPLDAISNVAQWIQWLGISEVPEWLLTRKVDTFSTVVGFGLLAVSIAPWLYTRFKKNASAKGPTSPLQLETFSRRDAADCIYLVGVRVTNVTDTRLNHCTVMIENIQASNPDSLFSIFSDSKLKNPSPKEEGFGLNPGSPKEIPIAQFDSINGRFENLGVELLCYSAERHEALDPEQSYILMLCASAEVGRPVRQQYKLSLDGLGRPSLEPVPPKD